MFKFLYIGKEERRFVVSGFSGKMIPNTEIEIPKDRVELVKKIFPRLLKSLKKKTDEQGCI